MRVCSDALGTRRLTVADIPGGTLPRLRLPRNQATGRGLSGHNPGMSTDFGGMIECRPGARLWGPEDEDSVWESAIDVSLLNGGNAYDALACLFGVRNTFGFRPLAEDRGLPGDVSDEVRGCFAVRGGAQDLYGTTWITWRELESADWRETDGSGTLSRQAVAGERTNWGPVWSVMRTLGELHGPENVRLVVWFY